MVKLSNYPYQIKLIVLDLDGVVVNSPIQKLPSPKLTRVISKLQSQTYVSIATGRVWSFAEPIISKLNIQSPVIVAGGAQIIHPQTTKIIWQKTIPSQSLEQVLTVFRQYPQWSLLANDFTEKAYNHHRIAPKNFKANKPIFFIEQAFIPKNTANKIKTEIDAIPGVQAILARSHKSNLMCVYVLHQNTSKKEALEKLRQLLNVNKEEVLVVGDGENDYQLFESAGLKVAMANAANTLKKQADLVIGSVETDSLAHFLETLIP